MCTKSRTWIHASSLSFLLFAVAMPAAPQEPSAEIAPTHARCANGPHVQMTLGLPVGYELTGIVAASQSRTSGPGLGEVCASIVRGSPYAVLNWLELGDIQGAIISQFAAQVMRSDDATAYAEEYVDFSPAVFTGLPRIARKIVLKNGTGAEVAPSRLDAFFASLRKSAAAATILLPDHLSPAVPVLLTRAVNWSRQQKLSGRERDPFLGAVVNSIRFRLYGDAVPIGAQAAALELAESLVTIEASMPPPCDVETNPLPCASMDRLVVRRRLLDRVEQLHAYMPPPPKVTSSSSAEMALFARSLDAEKQVGSTIAAFRDAHYRRYQVGNLPQRYFRFRIEELWSILQHEGSRVENSRADNRAGLALVLTGGGVKAAYQTRMIDHLYGGARLINDPKSSAAGHPPGTQPVDLVIGTSGGALLGVFVSAIGDRLAAAFNPGGSSNLTKIVWNTPGPGIRSRDVFPFLDMPRYATVLVAFLVLMLAARLAKAVHVRVTSHPSVSPSVQSGEPIGPGRRAESVLWYALLILSPLIVIKSSSPGGTEHVPAITGIVYAVMILIAIYSDVRLKRKARLTAGALQTSPMVWLALVIAAAALAAIFLALTHFRMFDVQPALGQLDPAAATAGCLGVMALAIALYLFLASQKNLFDKEPRWPILRAFLTVVSIVVLSYAAVGFATLAKRASLLEVTGSFWLWFLSAVALLSAVAVVLGDVRSDLRFQIWLRSTFEYLFGEYRSWTHSSKARRYARLVAAAFAAWIWWNLLAAPGLYGNKNALDYFKAAFTRFGDATVLKHNGVYPLAVPFAITATSLEKERELYFLFLAGQGGDVEVDKQLKDEAWSNIASDSRWFVLRNAASDDLLNTAFASGSPFPVFSAHDVKAKVLRTPEHLIDGGFAHNRPLDAARVLGATKVLVINSSPLQAGRRSARCQAPIFRVGELACNLPKLVPYLWDRSQIEDILSTKNMLVVSIYPTADGGGWPLLTDFRGEVVEQLIHAADVDMERRVGVVESWGPAQRGAGQLMQYDMNRL